MSGRVQLGSLTDEGQRAIWMRRLQWKDLDRAEFNRVERDLTDAEFRGMGLIQRREYEQAKARFEELDRRRA